MNRWVSTNEKRSFLKWLLQNHRLKTIEAKYVLDYLINHTHILENVHFTDKSRKSERMIIVSSTTSDQPGFVFYKDNNRTEQISKAVEDITLNPTEKIYITIHFQGKMMNYQYLNLIENPAVENIRRNEQSNKDLNEAKKVLDASFKEQRKHLLKKQIDEALDKGDKELFQKLVEELKQYEKAANE
jgi:uncharacterized protein YpiB (UPF0302 family)